MRIKLIGMGKRGPKPKTLEIVWSSEIAYAVGLMASDGYLSPDARHLIFVSKDVEQIGNLKECLNLKAKIGAHNPGRIANLKKYFRIQWSDVQLYKFFLSIGLTSRKSLTIGALSIPDEYFFDFLRGSFDGDGSFYSYFDPRWKSSFMFYTTFTSASRIHINWIQETLQKLIGTHGHVTVGKKGKGVFNLKYAKKESLIIFRHLYAEGNPICLSRKKLKITDALRIVGKSINSN